MKIDEGFLAKMREAAQLLQTEGPMAATSAIQRALHGAASQGGASAQPDWAKVLRQPPEMKDINPAPAGAAAGTYATFSYNGSLVPPRWIPSDPVLNVNEAVWIKSGNNKDWSRTFTVN